MHGVEPGDVLRLNRASVLGSRDYSLKAGAKPKAPKGSHVPGADPDPAYIDERLFVCRATVMGVVSEPLRTLEKTKRRQRHVKTVKSKHRYTVLRISELTVRGVDDIENGAVEDA
jgi:large subunit ribosomal protein L21